MSTFDLYSQYYDLLYRDKDYRAEVSFVSELIDGGLGGKDLLELGCGTGMHAVLLAELGYHVRGIDLSSQMLNVAASRLAQQTAEVSHRLEFELGDVRTYRGGRDFDAVISLFHVFSYQTTNADLAAAFRTAALHLRPGGALICDFWYGPAVLSQRPEVRIKRLQSDSTRIVRIAEPTVHFEKNVVDVNYEILIVRANDRLLDTINETHSMRYLFTPELKVMAEANDLQLERSMAWMSSAPLDATTWSGCAVFRKT